MIPPENGDRPGLLVGFISADEYQRAFSGIDPEPEEMCNRRIRASLLKHDDAGDRKSHPKLGCWLELTEIEFLAWVPDEDDLDDDDSEGDYPDDDGLFDALAESMDQAFIDDDDDEEYDEETMSIEEIRQQAQTILQSGSTGRVTAYLLENQEREPGPNDVNRTCGAPIGVSAERWPTIDGDKMEHAITLDLSSVPKLKARFPEKVAAVALFVSSLDDNQAFEPGNEETAIVLLSEQHLANGADDPAGPVNEDSESSTFVAHEVALPVEVFAEDIHEREEDDPVLGLSEALCQFSMAGGKPIWLQGPEHQGGIILQFDDSLVDMNLGDGGVMYVFGDTAFWQCH